MVAAFCMASGAAQDACRTSCAQKFPQSSQASQLNSCNASCGSAASANATPQSASGWNMSAAQRQLAVQNAEVQQSQQQLTNARTQEIQAQMNQMQAQQEASTAAGNAVQAGAQTGMIEGQFSAGKDNYNKRIDMVRNAIASPRAKAYTNRAAAVSLADPFADPAAKKSDDDQASFQAALAADCLEMGDRDHPAARVVACKAAPAPCKRMPAAGLYPVLQDGRMVDSAETLALFQKACSDASLPMTAMNQDGMITEVR